MMSKVLVYGSLMKSYWNHPLIKNQKYIGIGTLEGYEMYHVHSFPGIIKSKNNQEYIFGEVYEVTDDVLKKLDRLESEGEMYIRRQEKITVNGEEIEAYVYVWNRNINPGCEKVKTRPWEPKGSG